MPYSLKRNWNWDIQVRSGKLDDCALEGEQIFHLGEHRLKNKTHLSSDRKGRADGIAKR